MTIEPFETHRVPRLYFADHEKRALIRYSGAYDMSGMGRSDYIVNRSERWVTARLHILDWCELWDSAAHEVEMGYDSMDDPWMRGFVAAAERVMNHLRKVRSDYEWENLARQWYAEGNETPPESA